MRSNYRLGMAISPEAASRNPFFYGFYGFAFTR
jgi:hypothetical protein